MASSDPPATAPLITPSQQHDTSDLTSQDGASTSSPRRSSLATSLLVTTAGLSGLLFGFDTGIISSTLLYLPSSFELSTSAKASITAAPSLLALFAAPVSAPLADRFGRRVVILGACVLFILGAVMQSLAPSVAVVVLGRAVVGVAIGAASCVVPLYIGEIAPARKRGRYVTVQSLFVTGGQVLAYLVGWACGGRWRVAVGLGAVPAVVQIVLVGWLVETPRWLVMVGRDGEAREVLRGLEGVDDAEEVVRRIRQEMEEEGPERGRWRELLKTPGYRRALTIACMLQGLQQLCGFNVLMYFSATIFNLVGFTSPVMTSLSVAVTNFVFTLFAFSLIDTIGRRRILLISIPFMVTGLALCAVCFAYLPPLHTGGDGGSRDGAKRMSVTSESGSLPVALLVSLVLYVAAYALGLGCVPWQQSELFPLRVRSVGSGLATATNWTSNFIVGVSFLPLMELLGSTVTFSMYAGVCAVGWVLVYSIYPETAGLELEDVGKLLADGWGIRARTKGYVRASDTDQEEEHDDTA